MQADAQGRGGAPRASTPLLGLDIGSVGTKLVLIDPDGDVIHYIFTRTEGRPIEVVSRCLRELEEAVARSARWTPSRPGMSP